MRTTGAAVPGEPGHQAPTAFTPANPLRLWVAGDSLVIDPGYALQRAALATPVIKSVGGVDGRIGTGLDRPDVFNWFLEIRERAEGAAPERGPAQLRRQRRQGVHDGPAGRRHRSASSTTPAWRREYARRVGGLIDLINRAGAYVVWMGLPITVDPSQTSRFDRINAVVDQVIQSRPGGAAFVDTYRLLAGPNGGYAEYLENLSGEIQDVRAPDGVHLAPAGAAIVARAVLEDLNEAYDLTSWRKSATLRGSARRLRRYGRSQARERGGAGSGQVQAVGAEPRLAGAPRVPVRDLDLRKTLRLAANDGVRLPVDRLRLPQGHPDDPLHAQRSRPSRPDRPCRGGTGPGRRCSRHRRRAPGRGAPPTRDTTSSADDGVVALVRAARRGQPAADPEVEVHVEAPSEAHARPPACRRAHRPPSRRRNVTRTGVDAAELQARAAAAAAPAIPVTRKRRRIAHCKAT